MISDPLVNSADKMRSGHRDFAAGLLVVPLVTVPVRVWAAAARASVRIAVGSADFFASLVKRTP
jgi:hypothetical protein